MKFIFLRSLINVYRAQWKVWSAPWRKVEWDWGETLVTQVLSWQVSTCHTHYRAIRTWQSTICLERQCYSMVELWLVWHSYKYILVLWWTSANDRCEEIHPPPFNPLTPRSNLKFSIQLVHLVLDRSIILNWYFSLFSSLSWLILYWYCEEQFCLGHSRELKG